MSTLASPDHPDPPRACLEHLALYDFRLFAEAELELHPRLTVLVAPNGGGKTALLDGAARLLQMYIDAMHGAPSGPRFGADDARRVRGPEGQMVEQFPVRAAVRARLDGRPLAWSTAVESADGRMWSQQTSALEAHASATLTALRSYADGRRPAPPDLPVLAHYGTGRLWRPSRDEAASTGRLDRPIDAYLGGLTSASTYGRFIRWFEAVVLEAAAERESEAPSPHRPGLLLDAVRRATDAVLRPSGWGRLGWDFIAAEVTATDARGVRLPVGALSDGIRNLVALVADLAHRCVRLNPHLGADAPRRTPGVVLIDEVDLHLHPGWQQTILSALREAFGEVQFIVTTHSPQVLSTVRAECIRVIELRDARAIIRTPGEQTRGAPSPDVLAAVMGVDPVPDVPEWHALRRYHALIEDGEWQSVEAEALRARLDDHFGPRHPLMLDCDRLTRFQAFKSRREA